jgi:hypothetical protein
VSKAFAKQTGITVMPVEYSIRLANDKTTKVAGEASVYVQLGAFHKPVKCYVMDMLYEVDLILGEEFLDKYDCILHYGKGCILIRKGKRHSTVNSPALPRNQLPVDEEKFESLLSASQVKQLARKGVRMFLAVIRPVESDPVPPVVGSVAALSPDVPTSSIQPDQAAGPPGGEVPWTSELLSEFFEVFQDPLLPALPRERSEGHSIPTEPGHSPPFRSMYRLSPLEYQELEKQVTKDGILKVSQSPYGAPVLFVPKPNERGLRLCVDYRALNSITVKNRCTIPHIDDLLDAVAGSAFFTSLNLTSGYHQMLIPEEDRPKTAFRTPFGHFHVKVLIEGLTNAPATFQTVMNSILYPYIKKFAVVYIDDILIFSKTEAEHQAHVRLVLEVLKHEKFYVCKAKSSFAETEIKYLGHIVIKQGICPNPKKVEAIQTWPVPKNVHVIKSFLGLVNYFHEFIEHYSEIAVPLTDLTKKSHPWVWTGRCQDAFELLKQQLTEASLLCTPDESLPYEVVTDASDLGLGGGLLQECQFVAFESRKLNDAELNY